MEEVWRDIPGYEGHYQASTLGKIKSIDRVLVLSSGFKKFFKGRNIAIYLERNGYYSVNLSVSTHKKTFPVHKLIAKTFINNEFNKKTINHKDGIKTNNIVTNLEYLSHSENNKHAYLLGLRKPPMHMIGKFGRKHHNSKLVGQFTPLGELINIYWGTSEASRATGIVASNIGRAAQGFVKKSGGYMWKYAFEQKLKEAV